MGDAELWLGDSMEIMAAMGGYFSSVVSMILSDPPYLLTSGGCTKGGLHERFGKDPDCTYGNSGNLFGDDIPDWSEFMPLFFNVCAILAIATSWRTTAMFRLC